MNDTKNDKKKILVVEDEPVITEICDRVLTEEGFTVDTANDGKLAQSIIQKDQSYDLYLVDIRIPSMNGIELYQWMQEEKPEIIKHVIFTTGELMGGEAVDFIDNTGRILLMKPFTPTELKDAIKKAAELL